MTFLSDVVPEHSTCDSKMCDLSTKYNHIYPDESTQKVNVMYFKPVKISSLIYTLVLPWGWKFVPSLRKNLMITRVHATEKKGGTYIYGDQTRW